MALGHPAGSKLSDNQIAHHCGVSQPFVGKVRQELESTYNIISQTERTGADGRTIDTANIGKRFHCKYWHCPLLKSKTPPVKGVFLIPHEFLFYVKNLLDKYSKIVYNRKRSMFTTANLDTPLLHGWVQVREVDGYSVFSLGVESGACAEMRMTTPAERVRYGHDWLVRAGKSYYGFSGGLRQITAEIKAILEQVTTRSEA